MEPRPSRGTTPRPALLRGSPPPERVDAEVARGAGGAGRCGLGTPDTGREGAADTGREDVPDTGRPGTADTGREGAAGTGREGAFDLA